MSDEDNYEESGYITDDYGYSDDNSMFDIVDDDETVNIDIEPRKAYRVLEKDEKNILKRSIIERVISILHMDEEIVTKLLRMYKWDISRATEAWYCDSDILLSKLGIINNDANLQSKTSTGTSLNTISCLVCWTDFDSNELTYNPCGHCLCISCWKGYISASIEAGPSCLSIKCPSSECSCYVPKALVFKHASEKEKCRWEEFEERSFVDDNPSITWCTAPGCERVSECLIDLNPYQPLDIKCICGNSYCFNCHEEAHRPVNCETVKKWKMKNTAESENLNYILVNTKPCPQCKRPIEKNQGCMHMTCSLCRFEFCWLCVGPWSQHNESTGGFYACNKYESARRNGQYDEEARKRENAKYLLERYTHYYERWAAHDRAHKKAIEDRNRVANSEEDSTVRKLSLMGMFPEGDLKFILDSWNQVVECRRILKYTYAYGYYAFPYDKANKEQNKHKDFFEFLQGDAESSLEMLHSMVEKKLKEIVDSGEFKKIEFQVFRKNLIGLTDVTRKYFDKFVSALEKGFDKMEQSYQINISNNESVQLSQDQHHQYHHHLHQHQEPTTSSSSSSNISKTYGLITTTTTPDQSSVAAVPSSLPPMLRSNANDNHHFEEENIAEVAGFWQCSACTFANTDLNATSCAICNSARPM